MTEPAAHNAVKKLPMANGSAPGRLRQRELYAQSAINRKNVKRGTQMCMEYAYGQAMSAPLKGQLFLPMPLCKAQLASSNKHSTSYR